MEFFLPLFKRRHFGDWILCPSSGGAYLFETNMSLEIPPEDGDKAQFANLGVLSEIRDGGQCPKLR
jgi:hypothetical protein